jgi:hypothetical protein
MIRTVLSDAGSICAFIAQNASLRQRHDFQRWSF